MTRVAIADEIAADLAAKATETRCGTDEVLRSLILRMEWDADFAGRVLTQTAKARVYEGIEASLRREIVSCEEVEATDIDEKDKDPGIGGLINAGFGDKSLHARSHGEAFMAVLDHKFRRSGLFLLDEPEAALSPQRQLSFLILLHQTLRDYPRRAVPHLHPLPHPAACPTPRSSASTTPASTPSPPKIPPPSRSRRFLADPPSMLHRLLSEDGG